MPSPRVSFLVLAIVSLFAGAIWLVRSQQAQSAPVAGYGVPVSHAAVSPIPDKLELDARKVALGRRLFFDPRLSHDGSVACASCHRLDKAGQDGRRVAVGIGGQSGDLNTPTVLNSGFNFRQFWDGRAASLEEQVDGPIHNVREMASNWPEINARLSADADLLAEFKAIWPEGINDRNLRAAIAEFERSLYTPDSPFDRYLRGDRSALDARAQEGWHLFSSLGCIACHQGVNLGGNMFASLGIMGDFFADRGRAPSKADLGRFNVTGRSADRHMFKVPGLRNVALTGPYFHDGSVASLDEAVAVMARYQLGVRLAERERLALVAFLGSLTGRMPELVR
jgi:cytochrome c peroxidase